MSLDDIEDLYSANDAPPVPVNNKGSTNSQEIRLAPRRAIKKKAKAKQEEPELEEEKDASSSAALSSFVPPSQSQIHVRTWGCTHNASDGEYMSGLLADQGYTLTDRADEADLWLLNSCTVKNPAEDHFRNHVTEAQKKGKRVVAAGCVPQGRPAADYLRGVSMVGVQQIDKVVDVVEETLKGNTVRFMGVKKGTEPGQKRGGGAALDLPKVRRNPLIEIIAVNTGCLNQCTYCKTRHARGELGSYPIADIVARAEQSFREGVVEIWLTSEDTGAYGRDLGVTLPDLLWRLVEVIPEGCRLRVGMTNPPYIMDHLDEIAAILRHPRVYAFLHVPVQSGSDCVLRDMKREYTVDHFSRVVDVLREKVPGITIITDIICGFPTETDEDFADTMKLCRQYKFPSLFINQFFPRPGTPAARMKRVPTQTVKERTRELSDFFQSYEPYKERVGRRYQVLVTETSHDGKYYVGHNQFYEQVLVPLDPQLMGKLVEVDIVRTCKFSMTGDLVKDASVVQPTEYQPLEKGQVSGQKQKQVAAAENVQTQMCGQKTSWVYQFSVVILALAMIIRVAQLFYVTTTKK